MRQKGHIQLNGNDYLIDLRSYQKTSANPMAAKISSGQSSYDDLEDWSAWVMDDWRVGVGQKRPDAGGFLFGTAETRFENRLLMPLQVGYTSAASRQGFLVPGMGSGPTQGVTSEVQLASGGSIILAYLIYTSGSIEHNGSHDIWIYVDDLNGYSLNVDVYTDNSGQMGSYVARQTVTQDSIDSKWVRAKFSGLTLNPSTFYWIRIWASGGTGTPPSIPVMGPVGAGYAAKYENGSWDYTQTESFIFMTTFEVFKSGRDRELKEAGGLLIGTKDYTYLIDSNGLHYYYYRPDVIDWNGTGPSMTSVYAPSDATVLGKTVYMANEGSGFFGYTEGGSSTTFEETALQLAGWSGYLYRVDYLGDLYYTSDTLTWVYAGKVEDDASNVGSMAGMGQVLYINTTHGLKALYPGDILRSVTKWPSPIKPNYAKMINWMGDLYAAIGSGVVRITESGQILQMGLDRNEGLPEHYAGDVTAITGNTNWLFVGVTPRTTIDEIVNNGDTDYYGTPSVWAWDNGGWHHIASLLPGCWITSMYYEVEHNYLFVALRCPTGGIIVARIFLPDSTDNPLRNSNVAYEHKAWIEFPPFYGNLREVQKDFESVFIAGEEPASGASYTIEVYWQDDDSTDWELLGEATIGQELSWPDETRPNTKMLRLALKIKTWDAWSTPSIEAIRVKYHPMLTDRWRWHFAIRIHDNQEMLDGSIDTRSGSDIRSELKTIVRSVPPVTFKDLDGSEYKVKVETATETAGQYTQLQDGTIVYESVMQLTVRES